jgi:hypothetical protein
LEVRRADLGQADQQAAAQHRGQQRQPRLIRPCQSHISPRLPAQGYSQLMAQDQDLGVLPLHISLGQAQQRHGTSDDEEDQFQARKPKIHGTHG